MERSARSRTFVLAVVFVAGSFVLLWLAREARTVHDRSDTRLPAVPSDERDGGPSGPGLAAAAPVREARPRREAEPASVGPAITGIVTERSGRPVVSACCELHPDVPAGGFVARSEDPLTAVATTTSATDGSFRLEAGPGSWSVSVASPGFARFEQGHLRAGDELLVRLDLELELLVRVVDTEGAPVEGAELALHPRFAPSPDIRRCRMRSDANGLARTYEAAPGPWILAVRHPQHAAIGVPLEIPVGQPRFETTIALERGIRLTGTVRAEDDAPLGGAHLCIESHYRDGFRREELVCDEEGRYATDAVFGLQETLEVVASAPGHAESQVWLGLQAQDVSAGVVVQDFVLARGGRRVRGRVLAAREGLEEVSVRIAAIDPVGNGPQDTLTAIQFAPHAPWLWQEATRTDTDGAFELTGLSAAPQYVLMLVHERHAPRMVWVPPGAAGSVTELGDLELALPGSLFGRATFADGTPAEGELLDLFQVPRVEVTDERELGSWRPDSWFHAHGARVAADGRFRFELLAPGSYRFPAFPTGELEVEPGRATGPVDLVLPVRIALVEASGVVRNAAGEPVPMVFVRALVPDDAGERLASSCLVDARGGFTLRLPAEAPARLTFTDLRGVHEGESLRLAATPRSPLEVVLTPRVQPLPPLDGTVLGPRGEVVEGCTVTLHPPEDSLCACLAFHARTDPAGAFRFSTSEGPHRLVASDPRFASAEHYPAWPGDHVLIDLEEP